MKLMFIPADNYDKSGAFICMANLVDILHRKYDVEVVVVLHIAGSGTHILDEMGIRHVFVRGYPWCIPLDGDFSFKNKLKFVIKRFINKLTLPKLRQLIRKEKPDLIINNTSWEYLASIAANLEHVPYVWHLREVMWESQMVKPFCGFKDFFSIMSKAQCIIPASKYIEDAYLRKLDEYPEVKSNILTKINTIDEGICCDEYDVGHEIFDSHHLTIAMVGMILPWKGQMQLVKAIEKLMEYTTIDVEVLFVGDYNSEYGSRVRAYVTEKNLEENITFMGGRNDVPDILSHCDIAVVCSSNEGFGRVTVEGMMSGCLMIGAGSGATGYIIQDGVDGLLYEYGSHDDLANKILWAIKHPLEAKQMGQRAREKAMSKYTAEHNAEITYRCYEDVLRRLRQ